MKQLIITTVIICSAAFIGSLTGFVVKSLPDKLNDLLTAFSAGIMLYAGISGLIIPAIDISKNFIGIIFICLGMLCGGLFLKLTSKIIPYIEKYTGISNETDRTESLILFVLAVAIHHLPEGIATGVSFGTGKISDVITVTSGIAIQNFPEGMIIVPPMLSMGMNKRKILTLAIASSLIEAVGTFAGYFLISICEFVLPFMLSLAGGTILFVILGNMLPEIRNNLKNELSSFTVMLGFCFMCIINGII